MRSLLFLALLASCSLEKLGGEGDECPDPETGLGHGWRGQVKLSADFAIKDSNAQPVGLTAPAVGAIDYLGSSSHVSLTLTNGVSLSVNLPTGRDLFAMKTGDNLLQSFPTHAYDTCTANGSVTGSLTVLEATGSFNPKSGAVTTDFRRRFELRMTSTGYGCGVSELDGKMELDVATWSHFIICPLTEESGL